MKNLWNKVMSHKKLLWGCVGGVVCVCILVGVILLGGGNGGQGDASTGGAQLGGNTTESTQQPTTDAQPTESTGAEETEPIGESTAPVEPTEATEPAPTETEPDPSTEPTSGLNGMFDKDFDHLVTKPTEPQPETTAPTETIPAWVEELNCTYEDVTPETVWVVYTGVDIMKRPDGRYFGDGTLATPTLGVELKRTGIGTNDAKGLSRVEYNGKVGYIRSCVLVTAKPSEYSTEERTMWLDGAPLYYTYPDGSVHTQPVNGATWIDWDGVKQTHVIVVDERTYAEAYGTDRYCSGCGRHPGDGTNNTCLHYLGGGDHTCPHCGVVFAEKTCHTCGVNANDHANEREHCTKCGRVIGDGTNGTCNYPLLVSQPCEHCGAWLEVGVCHTCHEDD